MGKQEVEDMASAAFETALDMTGYGKFQWSVVLISGFIFMSVGFENGFNAYIMPSAQCDLKMTSQDKGHLNAAFLFGGIISAYFWGLLADHVGRKNVLVTSLMLSGLTTFVASFSQSFLLFIILRFLSGFLIGGPGSIISTYAGEFIGERQRAKCVCFIGFFWTLAWLLLPLIAMGILPLSFRIETSGFLFNSWRLYVLLFSVPCIVSSLLLYFCFTESPKFLYSQGRENEALAVLANMYHFNYGGEHGSYPVKRILINSTEGPPTRRSLMIDPSEVAHFTVAVSSGKSLKLIIVGVFKQVFSIYRQPHISATALSGALFFCNLFGYFGLALWLPELFDRFEFHYKHSNFSVTVCELTRLEHNKTSIEFVSEDSLSTSNDDIFCRNTVKEPSAFVNTFIIGVFCLVGNISSSLLANSMGLRLLTVITMGVSGLSAIVLYFLSSSWQILVIACVFQTFVGTANAVINTVTCDLFPTKFRGLGACAANLKGRLGAVCCNLVMGYALDTNCEVPIFLMASVMIVGSGLGFFLPGKDTTEDTCEVKPKYTKNPVHY